MAELRIIPQGTEQKCFVEIKDVAMDDIDFTLELIYGMRRKVMTIEKSQMKQDTQGNWFFIFETHNMVGLLKARLTWILNDTDCTDGERTKVNEQPLCFVTVTACTKLFACPCQAEDQPVTYTFTDESDIASDYVRLCDCYGHPIATSDDLYLYARSDVAQKIQEILDANENQNDNND